MPVTYANMRRKGATYAMARRRYPTYGRRGYAARKIQRAWRSRRRTAVANVRTGGFNNKELKFLDLAFRSPSLSTSGSATGGLISPSDTAFGSFTSITRGDGQNQRDGKKCFLKSIRAVVEALRLTQTGGTTGAANLYLALVLDTQTNGAQLNSEDVFSNTNASAPLCIMRNLEYSSRFKVLASKRIHLPATSATNETTAPVGAPEFVGPISTELKTHFAKKVFELGWSGNMVLDFSGNNSAITNSVRNSIQMVAFADNDEVSIEGQCRVRFYD